MFSSPPSGGASECRSVDRRRWAGGGGLGRGGSFPPPLSCGTVGLDASWEGIVGLFGGIA